MAFFASSARRFLDGQSLEVRTKAIDEVVWLTHNPELILDDPRIRPFFAPPVYLRIFDSGPLWIIYYWSTIKDDWIIANIGDDSETPHLWRQD